MAQNSVTKQDPIKQAYDANSTLKLPVWFLTFAVLMFSARIFIKQTQMHAPKGQGVAWLSPIEYKQKKAAGSLGKADLVLYEFTADWCPPCQKRERTTFRNPEVIKNINKNYVPVQVDLTTDSKSNEPETKLLTQKYRVFRIPKCAITLDTGEFVTDDDFIYGETFEEFLEHSVKRGSNVRAQLLTAKGQYKEAMTYLDPDVLKGADELYYSECADYILCHHLLTVLNRQAEIEPMMEATYKTTVRERTSRGEVKSDTFHWLDNLNSLLRGQETGEQAIENMGKGDDSAGLYLATGLKNLRDGDIEKAKKNLNKAAIEGAHKYHRDKLAEHILKEIDK